MVAGIRAVFAEVATIATAPAVRCDNREFLLRRMECETVAVGHLRRFKERRIVIDSTKDELAVAGLSAGGEHQESGGMEREVGHVSGVGGVRPFL